MTSTRRAFLSSAFAGAFGAARTAAGKEATPGLRSPTDTIEILQSPGAMIDLTPYAAGWQPDQRADSTVLARSKDIVMDGFDLATGEQRWSTELRAAFPNHQFFDVGFTASPRWGESVAIGHTDGADLFAVDSVTGEALWHLRMNSPEGLDGIMSQNFALHSGRIFGMSTNSHLFARDERTAEVLWVSELPFERLWDTIGVPVVGDRGVYLVDETMHIHAVDIQSGERMWTRQLGPEHQLVYPQTVGDAVLANLEWEGVKRLNPDTGEDLWSIPDFLPFRHVETAANGRVVIGIQPNMDMITAIDLDTGETLWKQEPDEASVKIVAQASNASGVAIAGADDRIIILDAMSGEERTVIEGLRLALAYPQSVRALAMTDEWLFASTDNERITIIDLATGEIANHTSVIGITDGVVPVNLWMEENALIAHAPGLRLGTFRFV